MIENEKLTQLLTRTEDEKLVLKDKNKGVSKCLFIKFIALRPERDIFS